MSRLQNVLYKIFIAVFSVLFLWLSYISVFRSSYLTPLNPFVVILGVAAVFAFAYALYRLTCGVSFGIRSENAERIMLATLFITYIALQLVAANDLVTRLGDSWDFEIIVAQSIDTASHGFDAGPYFAMWPNNIPILVLVTTLLKGAWTLGVTNLTMVGIYFNIIFIDVAILFTYLYVKKLTSRRSAGFISLVLSFLTFPYLLYVAIYYTDTLTLPFPVIALYLWECCKTKLSDNNKKRAALLFALMMLFIVMGTLLKITVSFVAIAVVIDAVVTRKPKEFLVTTASAAILFCAFFFPLKALIYSADYLPEAEEKYYIPSTHWIMMGLSGNGGYNDDDYQLTLSVDGAKREEFIADEIARRLKDYGFVGLLEHLADKTEYVWSDGTYTSAVKIDRDRTYTSTLDTYFNACGSKFYIGAHLEQFIFSFTLIGAFAGGILSFIGKKKIFLTLLPCQLCLFGLFLFECISEARTRYLFNYLPIFITLSAVVFCEAAQLIKNFKPKRAAK